MWQSTRWVDGVESIFPEGFLRFFLGFFSRVFFLCRKGFIMGVGVGWSGGKKEFWVI